MRTTGATDEQIEAALCQSDIDNGYRCRCPICIRHAQNWSSFLVDTDHRIVRVDDLRALLDSSSAGIQTPAVRRIAALIGEAE